VVSIQGTDKDSIGPNKWMTFTLHGQTRLGSNQPEKCKELFRLETVDNSTGNVLVNVPDMLDCTGNYDIIVQVEFFLAKQMSTRIFQKSCSYV
jgi:hypothetical protein